MSAAIPDPDPTFGGLGGTTIKYLPPPVLSVAPPGKAIRFESEAWNETDIPVRPWLAVGYLLRGAVTVVVGPGGVSKSSLMLSWAVGLALGVPCHAMTPLQSCRVMTYNVEDDADEQRRRLSAILTRMGRTPEHIAGRIERISPEDTGTLITRDAGGLQIDTDVLMEIEERIEAFGPDILILDPLAELHTSEENDNTALRAVIARFRSLADKHYIALVIIHHTRKGVVVPGDADATRGASSIASAARVLLTVSGMTELDAKAFGLPAESRKHYFRVDGGKSNYASVTDAEWFERVSYALANGDNVVAVTPWTPPSDICTTDMMTQIEAGISEGSPIGPWSPELAIKPRSVKNLMVEVGVTTQAAQKSALAAILKKGFVVMGYKNTQRQPAKGLRSPLGKPSQYKWDDATPG
jgi:hypothetical protein